MKTQTINNPRTPTLLESLFPIFTMVVLLGGGYAAFDLPPEPLMVLSTVVAALLVKRLGYRYDEILTAISQKIAKTMPALLILISVGLLIGTWMVGGTIPLMIYYGLKMISPEMLYVTALLVTSLVSVCTGTSWGSAGTIGVAFMGVAVGMEANLAATAGAVVAGAYFGDKLSPLSGDTNLAAMAARIDLYQHICHLLYTTLPSLILTAIIMTVYGMNGDLAGQGVPEKVTLITNGLENIYHFNLILLIPVLVILYGSVTKKPTIPVMLASAAIAMLNAYLIQGFGLHDIVKSAVDGFNVSMIQGKEVPELLGNLFCLDWVCQLTGISDVGAMLKEIEQHAHSDSSLLFLPYLSGERTPYNNADAKGVFWGLTHQHQRADLCRAVLEGVSFALRQGIEVADKAGQHADNITLIGGGARSEYWRQLLADITGKTLDYRQGGDVGPALGAARLAQLAINPAHLSQIILSQPKLETRHVPNLEKHKAYQDKYNAFKKLYTLIETMKI
ncbi:hypothetical protein OMG73_002055 [Proteus mirabilis]|nr:hypothetical protein [Proteus mirabilis]